jgi:hypothetical protein
MEANMTQTRPTQNSIKGAAYALRHHYLAQLFRETFVAITDELRRHHETWLREAAGRRARFQNRLGTPA